METQVTKMKSKFLSLDLIGLGERHHFHLRKSGKFSSIDFVLGFFLSFLSGQNSLRTWAEQISYCSGRLLSKQGLASRLNHRLVNFCKAFLLEAIDKQVLKSDKSLYQGALFKPFKSVKIEDSTCLSLPDNLATQFPGSYSRRLKGSAASARIQLRYSLKEEQYVDLAIQSYRQNDQSYAYELIPSLKKGELILRDLGYFVLGSFRAIMAQGAHLLSRYRFGISLFSLDTAAPICLVSILRRVEKSGKIGWDQPVLVGKKEQLPLRLVAIRLPKPQVEQRIRKAKKNRNQKAGHSEAYFELLKWNLFLTSVSTEVWTGPQVAQAYGLRWRIEMIFKTWKKHLNLAQLFLKKQSLTYERVMIQIYLLLSWILLFLLPWFRFFSQSTAQEELKSISMGKFAQWAKTRFEDLLVAENLRPFEQTVRQYCMHESRQKRKPQAFLLKTNSLA